MSSHTVPAGGPRPAMTGQDPYRYGDTIHDVFEYQAARRPGAVALVQGGQATTYGELAATASALAARFAACGVAPGGIAIVWMRRSPLFAAALLAILKLGAAYLAAEQAWPAGYVQQLLDRADAWLVTDELDPGLRSRRGMLTVDAQTVTAGRSAPLPHVPVSGADACTIFHTSGSTGSSKLAVVPHRATVRAFIGVDYAHFGPGRVIMQASPVCWDGLTMELWSVLLSGGTSLIPPEEMPVSGILLRACIQDHGLDTVWLTSSLFSALVDDDLGAFAGLRQVMSGGERVSVDHVRRLREAHPGIRFSSGYGPVETTVFATSHTISDGDLERYGEVPLGHPMPATTVLVLGESGNPCPPGKTGEIYIGGDALGLGYLGDAAQTKRRFIQGPGNATYYRTGDLGQWHDDGVLLFRGRVDRQLKVRGKRVEPEELERFITSALPGVTAAVVAVRDGHGQVTGVAAHCGTARPGATEAEVRQACDEGLPPHSRPRRIIMHAELPRTSNGKIDYKALERATAAAEPPALATVDEPPPGSLESLITQIASALLGVPVGPASDLFGMGGDSLFVMRLTARLRLEHGVRLAAGDVCRTPTAQALAAVAAFDSPGRDLAAAGQGPSWTLSPGEADLCLHEEIFPGDPALLALSAYELTGKVDIGALRSALVRTCTCHRSLGSVRVPEAGTIRGRELVAQDVEHQLRAHLTGEILDDQDGTVVFPPGWLEPFDLARDLPLRMHIAGRPGGRRLLGFVTHHVAMDGWSEHIFADDLSRSYAEVTGRRQPGPRTRVAPGPPRLAGQEERDAARKYWQALLAELEPLPVPRAWQGHGHFAERRLMLTGAEARALAALPGGRGNLHAGALAWYADALRHAFGRDDFAIGSAYAARDLTDEHTIGYHVQMIPLRVRWPPDMKIGQAATEVAEQWMDSLNQRSISLREIAAAVPEKHMRRYRPVFQAGFALQNRRPACLELGGASHPRLAVRPAAPPFELYLELWPLDDGGLAAHLQWDVTSVAAGLAEEVARNLHTTMASLA
jgi:amino acid adenylation domain-containing protein